MIGASEITREVAALGVAPDDVLFVHAGLQRALSVEGRTREQKLDTIVQGLSDAVPDGVLAMPAFSYSFCDGADFVLDETPSSGVGVLPEYFRTLPGVRRTTDPLFSAAIRGTLRAPWEQALFEIRDVDCFGAGSVFDMLRDLDAKLLFFGVASTACTFVHYVEQQMEVPYRYHKQFPGTIRAHGREAHVTANFYVRDLDQDVETFLAPLGDDMLVNERARASAMTNGPSLYVTDPRAVTAQVEEGLAGNPDYLLRRGHPGVTHLYPLLAP
ncbi:MAG TPA: AAC(3) family N-acetyltransferase [Thermoleophilaceae bacterium]|nr:AAC(3) family N-acetyltransferase [Thermoleophilaceae bacterium]